MAENRAQELDATIDSHKQRLEILAIEHRQSSAERRDAAKAKAQVECLVRDAEEAGSACTSLPVHWVGADARELAEQGRDRLSQLEDDLAAVEVQISEKETELLEAVPAWEDKLAEEKDSKQRLEAVQTTLGTLYAKQGRISQFKTQKERDTHLRAEIASRTTFIATREKRESEVKRELTSAKKELEDSVQKFAQLREELDGRKATMAKLSEELAELKGKQATVIENRKYVACSSSTSETPLTFLRCAEACGRRTVGNSNQRRTLATSSRRRSRQSRQRWTGFVLPSSPGCSES